MPTKTEVVTCCVVLIALVGGFVCVGLMWNCNNIHNEVDDKCDAINPEFCEICKVCNSTTIHCTLPNLNLYCGIDCSNKELKLNDSYCPSKYATIVLLITAYGFTLVSMMFGFTKGGKFIISWYRTRSTRSTN
jgi:hypothetical protein